MSDSFGEQDVYAETEEVSGIKPTLSMMHSPLQEAKEGNAHTERMELEEGELSLDESPNLRSSIKKKEVGFGSVEIAPPPKKSIGFGTVFMEPEPPQETKPISFFDPRSPQAPPPPLDSNESAKTIEDFELDSVEEEREEELEFDPVAERYFAVAEQFAEGGDKAAELRGGNEMPSRSPYKAGMRMMHGANYFPAFKTFLLNGGCGHYKNSVMLNIRVNNIAELDVMDGTCKLNFFLDCAFWVPEFNVHHYSDPETIGHFAVYEPIINFPEMKEVNWLKRNVEFSKHPGARRHEVQLGQNFETAKKVAMPSKTEFLTKRNSNKESPSTPKLRKRVDNLNHPEKKKPPPKRPGHSRDRHGSGDKGSGGGGAPATTLADNDGWEPMNVEMGTLSDAEKAKARAEAVTVADQPPAAPAVQRSADLWKKSIQSARRTSTSTKTFKDAVNMISSASHAADAFTANLHRSNTRKEATAGHASDIYAHWPRMWRVLLSDEDMDKFNAMSKAERKKVEPTNSKPQNVPKEMKEILLALDAQREKDLSHPDEGIVFSTYEIGCLSRQTYELFDFPFDLQDVDIVVRLEAPKADPLKRHIIPCCHDKAMFCSSRVPPLTEWLISKNLDWYVEKGVGGNVNLDGGKERLVASILVLRKSYYYSRHYIFILFLMTTSVFFIFTIEADQVDARSNIVFSLLLTVVAFNYSCSESIPKVPYATILEVFINTCFLSVLVVGAITFGFTFIESNMPELYSKSIEQYCGLASFFIWCMGNFVYWYDIFHRTEQIMSMVEEDEQIGWLKFKEKKFDDTTRARGLGSVKTEPRLTQMTNMMKRATSVSEKPHVKLREEVLKAHSPHHVHS